MSKTRGNDDPRGNKGKGAGIKSRWNTAKGSGGGGDCNWGYCDGNTMTRFLHAVAVQGAAVTLGYSRDGGAYMVIILDGEDRIKEWIPSTTDITEALENITDTIRAGDL